MQWKVGRNQKQEYLFIQKLRQVPSARSVLMSAVAGECAMCEGSALNTSVTPQVTFPCHLSTVRCQVQQDRTCGSEGRLARAPRALCRAANKTQRVM